MSNAAPHANATPSHFINEETGLDVRINKHLPHITMTAEDGTVTRYVPIQAHLDLMDQRDDYRRTTALINALRSEHAADLIFNGSGEFFRKLTTLLAQVGEDDDTARAMRSLIGWAQDMRRTSTESGS